MKAFRLYLYRLLSYLLPETRCFALKRVLLRWGGCKIGRNVRICSSAMIFGNGELSIGDDVWIGEKCFVKATKPAHIIIGSCCDIAPQVSMNTGTHEIDASGEHVAGKGCGRSIEIGDGCWIGMRGTILPGVRLASRTLVAAGAVVTSSIEDSSWLVAGVPAALKRKL